MPPPASLSKYGIEEDAQPNFSKYGIEPDQLALQGFEIGSRYDPRQLSITSAQTSMPPDIGAVGGARNPINEQHPQLSWRQRALLQNLAGTDPETTIRHLEKLGFQGIANPGGNYGVKRPEEKDWRQIEKIGPEFSDLTDVLGGTATTAAEIAGGFGGGVLGLPGGPIGVGVGAITGATIAGAGTEAQLMGLGKLLGLDPALGEVGGSALREGIAGGIGEATGQALRLGGHAAKWGVQKATGGAMARGRIADEGADLALKTATVKAETQEPIARLARARADLAAARLRARTEAQAEAEAIRTKIKPKSLEAAPPAGAATAPEGPLVGPKKVPIDAKPPPRAVDPMETLATGQRYRQAPVDIFAGTGVPNPATGMTAKHLRDNPQVEEFLRYATENPHFVSPDGSKSMANRLTNLSGQLRILDPGGQKSWWDRYRQRAADFFQRTEVVGELSPEAKASVQAVAGGAGTEAEKQAVDEIARSYVSRKKIPAHLSAAREAYEQAIPPARAAQATRSEFTTQSTAKKSDLLKRSMAAGESGAAVRDLSGMLIGRSGPTARLLRGMSDPILRGIGKGGKWVEDSPRLLGSAAATTRAGSSEVSRMIIDRVGSRVFEKLLSASPEAIQAMATRAPPGVRAELQKIAAASRRGPRAVKAAIAAAMLVPGVREFLNREE